ncbi:hypothetical protein [Spirulina sp. CS-785/01]|uniref:hypothetical protein n=1 Tax=Spirulina sp. CS-785/01 TaxID=3021716 RepID=UPI00232A7EFF|nr:hypothetical protein [Spirulina sp. CS-785/01]
MSLYNVGMGGISVMHSNGVLWHKYIQSAIYAVLVLITVLMSQGTLNPEGLETVSQSRTVPPLGGDILRF